MSIHPSASALRLTPSTSLVVGVCVLTWNAARQLCDHTRRSSVEHISTLHLDGRIDLHGEQIREASHLRGVLVELLTKRVRQIMRRISGHQQHRLAMLGQLNSERARGGGLSYTCSSRVCRPGQTRMSGPWEMKLHVGECGRRSLGQSLSLLCSLTHSSLSADEYPFERCLFDDVHERWLQVVLAVSIHMRHAAGIMELRAQLGGHTEEVAAVEKCRVKRTSEAKARESARRTVNTCTTAGGQATAHEAQLSLS